MLLGINLRPLASSNLRNYAFSWKLSEATERKAFQFLFGMDHHCTKEKDSIPFYLFWNK